MIEHTNTWAQGDIAQGKLMLVVGVLVLIATILAWRNGGELFRGMLIPLVLIILIATGYGGFMLTNRAAHAKHLAERYQQDPEGSRATEIARVGNDCKNYRMMNFIWSAFFLFGDRVGLHRRLCFVERPWSGTHRTERCWFRAR